jgi:hypothetical protein
MHLYARLAEYSKEQLAKQRLVKNKPIRGYLRKQRRSGGEQKRSGLRNRGPEQKRQGSG